MKKLLKWIFIGMFAITAIAMIATIFMSDEEKADLSFNEVVKKFEKAESEYDVSDVFGKLNVLASENPSLQSKVDSLYELKQQFVIEATKRGINNNQYDAWYYSRDFITKALKAPSTAKFAKYGESKVSYDFDKEIYHVEMWVDAQNSFGTMLRKTYHVQIKRNIDIDNNETWSLIDMKE
ncbi:hypothetical protein [uncultured Draconibacterium sp.]|uniref:hypothetical protein n=1 Tax=uncultured Draconibacterium sp. TaxID=1573823 RepID=UPI0029C96C6C|nr:hypothetical protein [uncultured Draconibacterium sp.]